MRMSAPIVNEGEKARLLKLPQPSNAALPSSQTQLPLYWSVLHHKHLNFLRLILPNIKQEAPPNTQDFDVKAESPHNCDHLWKGHSHKSTNVENMIGISADPSKSNSIAEQGEKKNNGSYGWNRVREMLQTEELFIHDISQFQENPESFRASWKDSRLKQGTLSDFDDTHYEMSLRECFFLAVLLLAVGALAFSYIFEQWRIFDSLYFTTVLLTTVGYGDMIPSNKGGKLFITLFGLFGVVILGLALGVVGSRLVEAEIKYAEKMREKSSKALEKAFTTSKYHQYQRTDSSSRGKMLASSDSYSGLLLSSLHSESIHSLDSIATENQTNEKCSRKKEIDSGYEQALHLLQHHLPAFATMLIGAFVIASIENWGWVDMFYYCVVTSTTIGFGDLTPKKPLSKILGIILVPLSVGSCGYMLGNFASAIVEHRREKFYKKILMHDLTMEDLDVLDTDGDGEVNELEYIRFMLVAMKKVDSQLFEDLHQQFLHLDQTGDGKITRMDLKIMAKQKMKKVSNKLKLSGYKVH